MRIVMLSLALLTFAVPAFADCMTHQAAKPDAVATTTTPEKPATPPASGG